MKVITEQNLSDTRKYTNQKKNKMENLNQVENYLFGGVS